MRVVFDTNVTLSGLFWRGIAYHCLELARRREISSVYCGEMIAELSDTMRKRLDSPVEDIQFAAHYMRRTGERVEITNTLRIIERDPDDDKFVECAVVGGANFIISRDL